MVFHPKSALVVPVPKGYEADASPFKTDIVLSQSKARTPLRAKHGINSGKTGFCRLLIAMFQNRVTLNYRPFFCVNAFYRLRIDLRPFVGSVRASFYNVPYLNKVRRIQVGKNDLLNNKNSFFVILMPC